MSIESLKHRLEKANAARRDAEKRVKAAMAERDLAERQYQKINRQLFEATWAMEGQKTND